jgi:hypothetical protein
MKLDPYFSACISTNLKWMKDFNVRPKTVKLLQERMGKTLEQIGIDNNFFKRVLIV